MQKTPIDEALENAKLDPKQVNFFYDAFLNTDWFFPVEKEGGTAPVGGLVSSDTKFRALMLVFPEGRALPIFDLESRLQDWVGDRQLDYAKVKGYILFRLLDERASVLLNLGTPFHYTLTSEILTKLKTAMKVVNPS